MSLPDFDRAALEIVSELGTAATYTSIAQGGYDPVTGTTGVMKSSQPVKAVLFDLTLQSNGMSLRYGTEILAGDKEAYMIPPQKTGGTAMTISPGTDKLTVAGVAYTVVTFKELNPTGSDPVVYFLYLRR